MVFFRLVCEKIPVHDGFFYSHPFFCLFFIPNTTAICKNKIRPSSEPKIISKELENSHLSSFSVNLTGILELSPNIVGMLSLNIVKNGYLSASGNPQSCS